MNGILNDMEIAERARAGMIEPFHAVSVTNNDKYQKALSYGLSSFGYDIQAAPEFRIFTDVNTGTTPKVIDPLNFDPSNYIEVIGDSCIIPPNSFILTRSKEKIVMPDDLISLVITKSTLARCGIMCLATPLEPGWSGYITLEFANTSPVPVVFHANMGCAQLMFFKGNTPLATYSDRSGKYQNQPASIINPRA